MFRPRKSRGWLWPVIIAVLMLVVAALTLLAVPPGGEGWSAVVLTAAISTAIALPFLVLAIWFPTMRYELADETLMLHYGPVLHYRIPLGEVQVVRRRNLRPSVWSSFRFPGLALFTVAYSDVGSVKMCATAAADRILLVETGDTRYGLTPADEEAFVTALQARIEG